MITDNSRAIRTAKHFIVILTLALTSAACGGGGSSVGVAVIPPPPAPPAPPAASPAIIPAAATSQQFATVGASYTNPLSGIAEDAVSAPSLVEAAQLDVRYDAGSQRYEIQLPTEASWRPITRTSTVNSGAGNPIDLYLADSLQQFGAWNYRAPANLQYSALFQWWTATASGYSAFDIATPPGSVPVTGSASYAGSIQGSTTETFYDPWGYSGGFEVAQVYGTINLDFNFGSGSLTGRINPIVAGHLLQSLTFTNTVYSTGSTTFAGAFQTPLSGINSFSGRFTGPAAQELIGNFAFPYISPTGGGTEQAAGAFVGRRP